MAKNKKLPTFPASIGVYVDETIGVSWAQAAKEDGHAMSRWASDTIENRLKAEGRLLKEAEVSKVRLMLEAESYGIDVEAILRAELDKVLFMTEGEGSK